MFKLVARRENDALRMDGLNKTSGFVVHQSVEFGDFIIGTSQQLPDEFKDERSGRL